MTGWRFLILPVAAAFCCLWLPQAVSGGEGGFQAPPLMCAGSGGMPVMLREALSFCGNNGLSCCNEMDDEGLRQMFLAMNTTESDADCYKATLCQKCDPFHSASPSNVPPPCAPTPPPSPPHSANEADAAYPVCLEHIATDSFVHMAAHPDGSSRVFLSTHEGKIWLASLHDSPRGGARTLSIGGSPPFLDLTDRVFHGSESELGLKGVAFHPEFPVNGRFFVSYYCNSVSQACSVGTYRREEGCGLEVVAAGASGGGYRPCQYNLVVAEFSASGGVGSEVSAFADPIEVRRLFTMGLPQQPYTPYSHQQQDGQLLFRPGDGYLYLITGNGGDKAHGQFDFSQNERSFLGKIIRFDVDGMASNPVFVAMGLGNPRGCNFEMETFSYYCAGIDQEQQEQVYQISNKEKLAGDAVKAVVSNHGRPGAGGRPSIIGGLVYRGSADPTLYGRYLYMYEFALWTRTEGPAASSGHDGSERVPGMMCSRNTPLPCTGGIGGRVLSFGEDNRKDAFILATDGVYRVVSRGLCSGGAPPRPLLSTWKGLVTVGSPIGLVATFALYALYTKLLGGECSFCLEGILIANCCGHVH